MERFDSDDEAHLEECEAECGVAGGGVFRVCCAGVGEWVPHPAQAIANFLSCKVATPMQDCRIRRKQS